MTKSIRSWLILLLITDLFFTFLLWVTAAENFSKTAVMMFLFIVLIALLGCYLNWKRQQRVRKLVKQFLDMPDERTIDNLLRAADRSWYELIADEASQRKETLNLLRDKTQELQSYQEFIEEWIHEIKTPLALSLMVLENHREEMSEYVYSRMEHIRHTIHGDVDRILYYARLHASHVDYHFERFYLDEFVAEKLEDYKVIYEEKKIEVQCDISRLLVVSDKKVLTFILSQLFSNAFKYADPEHGVVQIACWSDREQGNHCLAVRNNGAGVPEEDRPFIFDKGFTGGQPKRQNATGMGLYFARKYAKALSLRVEAEDPVLPGMAFGIRITFPVNEP